jgi:tripartite-type tricarboxylate transporter receptor subunit TctC
MPKAKTAPKKIVKEKKIDKIEKVSEVIEETSEPKEVVLEKTSNVMTKKDRISDVKATPTIVDVQSKRIHVKAINNN